MLSHESLADVQTPIQQRINEAVTQGIIDVGIQPQEMTLRTAELVRAASEALAQRPDAETEIMDIARGSAFRGHELYSWARLTDHLFPHKDGVMPFQTSLRYRAALIKIYGGSPEAAEIVAEKGIVGLHASGSSSLIPIMRSGVTSLAVLRDGEQQVHTGARDATGGMDEGIFFITLAGEDYKVISRWAGGKMTAELLGEQIEGLDQVIRLFEAQTPNPVRDSWIAQFKQKRQEYEKTMAFLEVTPKDAAMAEQQALVSQNFPVIWGLSSKGITDEKTRIAKLGFRSDIPGEFVAQDLDRSDTPVVFVPRDLVSLVEGYAQRENWQGTVLAIEESFPDLAKSLRRRIDAIDLDALEPSLGHSPAETGTNGLAGFLKAARYLGGRVLSVLK